MKNFKKVFITLWAQLLIISLSAQYSLDPNYGSSGTFENPVSNIEFKDLKKGQNKSQYIIAQIGENFALPFIAKVNPYGALDTTFNEDGAIIQWFMDDRQIIDLVVGQDLIEDGGIYTLYQGNDTTDIKDDLLIMKYLENGSIDDTWAANGQLQITPPASSQYTYEYHSITSHLVGPALVVTGIRRAPGTCDQAFLYGISGDGEEVLNFGTDGLVTIDINSVAGNISCNYSITGINEKGGTLVMALENNMGEATFAIARSSNSADGSVNLNFPSEFLYSNLDYFDSEGYVFINYPLLFDNISDNLVEQTSFLDWLVLFKQDNISVLHIPYSSEVNVHTDINLPTDASYRDVASRYSSTDNSTKIYLTGERDGDFHLASIALCDDESETVQTTDLDLAPDAHSGIFIDNQSSNSSLPDSLVIMYGSEGLTSLYTMIRLLGNSSCVETEIQELTSSEALHISVSPNPISDRKVYIKINAEKTMQTSLQLNALDGSLQETLIVRTNSAESIAIPEHIPSGLYVLSIETEHGMYTEKVIIQ